MPCRTIRYAVESMSKEWDTILVVGTQSGGQARYNEADVFVDKEIYIKGVNGKPVVLCGMNSVIFKVKNTKFSLECATTFIGIVDAHIFYPSKTFKCTI